MNPLFKSLNFRLFCYAFFYGLTMYYGIDLVQSQGSQILPYMEWFNNRELFQNDLMGMTFPYYASYSLWYHAAGILAGIVPAAVVIGFYFFAQCFVEVYGLRFLTSKLFPGYPESFNWIIIILFTFGGVLRHSLGSVAPFGWTVFPDTFATGLLLFALGYFFDKRYLPAFIITAVSFYFHLTLTLFVFLIFCILYLLRIKDICLNQTIKTGLIFSIIVIPLGLRILFNPIPPLTSSLDLWMSSIKNFQGMHAFPSRFGAFQYIPFFFWVIPFVVSFRFLKNTEKISEIKRFCGVAAALLLLSTLFTEIIPVKTVIKLSLFRGSRFILIPAVFCTIALLFHACNQLREKIYLKKIIIMGGIFVTAFFIFLNIIIFHPVYREYPGFVKSYFEKINTSDNPVKRNLLYQTVKDDRHYAADWVDVQKWCRDNTPYDKLILSPYHLRGFRSYSERGIVFQYRDAQLHVYWEFLFDVITGHTSIIGMPMDDFNDPTEYQVALKKLYKNYTIDEISSLANQFNFSYIVTETDHVLDLPLAYKNSHFSVYLLEMD